MFESQKHVFWQALLLTILVFSLGLIFGIVLENWRSSKVNVLYQQSEINLLDIKAQADIYTYGEFNCEKAIVENINFADKIYNESKLLEKYQKSSVLKTEEFVFQHDKYDVLRSILWLNSLKIKKSCNASYFNVVYIYKYHTADYQIVAKETVFSNLLSELKERKGNEILLIPLAADTNITSVTILMDKYNVSRGELPVILINEKIKIRDIKNIEELVKYFEKTNTTSDKIYLKPKKV